MNASPPADIVHHSHPGRIIAGDSRRAMATVPDRSVATDQHMEWFRPFGIEIRRITRTDTLSALFLATAGKQPAGPR